MLVLKILEDAKMKKFFMIAVALMLVLSLAACGGGGGASDGGAKADAPKPADDPEQAQEEETAAGKEAGIYVLYADGAAQVDFAEVAGEGGEGFVLNYFFSLYASQTSAQSPPGAGGYEGAARLTSQSNFDEALGGMLEGLDLPAMASIDMSSHALARSLVFDLRKDDSDTDVELRADVAPIFEGGKQFTTSVSAGGYDSSQTTSDTGACPLPMTIEVFGSPGDNVRPALITLNLCEDGSQILKIDGTLSFVPWSGNEKFVDSDEFKARIDGILEEGK